MTEQALFADTDEGLIPQPIAAGPWGPRTLHGRVLAGLMARAIEQAQPDEAFLPARLTVDLYRMPGFTPATVTTQVVRSGRRIKVIDAEYRSDGKSMARVSSQWLRRSANPDGNRWATETWQVPPPGELVSEDSDWKHWEARKIEGDFGSPGRRRLWMRELCRLVDEDPLTPWQRVALAADFVSPYANADERGIAFINSDFTLYLHRLPETEWIGFDVVHHAADKGIALGECRLYDEIGLIGTVATCALVNPRARLAARGE